MLQRGNSFGNAPALRDAGASLSAFPRRSVQRKGVGGYCELPKMKSPRYKAHENKKIFCLAYFANITDMLNSWSDAVYFLSLMELFKNAR